MRSIFKALIFSQAKPKFLAVAMVLMTLYSCAGSNSLSILHDQPVFTLGIQGANTAYFVRLNGTSVHREFSSQGQLKTQLPVNHWMRPGINTLAIEVLPLGSGSTINENAEVAIELFVHRNGDGENKFSVAKLMFSGQHSVDGHATSGSSEPNKLDSTQSFKPSNQGDVTIYNVTSKAIEEYEGAVLYEMKVDVPSSLPLWAYFESDELQDYDAMDDEDYYSAMDDLFVEYKKVQDAIAKNDIDGIMPMFEERNRETDAAFYLEPGTTERGIRSDLIKAANNEDLELVELAPDYVGFTLEENRKLVSLTRNGLRSAIALNYKSMEGSARYHLIFRRENGKWILAR